MSAARLLAHYERIVDEPDAIARLRRFILNLAVRGKLLPQDPNDEPVFDLLKRIPPLPKPARYEKRSPELIQGDCGLSINHPGTELPKGWLWVPLVQIARLESGHTPSRNRPEWWGGDVPWIGLVDARLHNNGTIFKTIQSTNEQGLANSAARLLPQGTVCFSRTASVGYVVIMGRPMATSQDFVNWVPTDAISSSWLQLVMIAERPAIDRFSKGAVHQTIYYPAWLSMHIALPSPAEQSRIVAKVDELMSLCDRLEAARGNREGGRDRLAAASLARLNAFDSETFQADARFTLDALPALTARPDQIKQLRQTILNLAVRGKLVPQEPNDEPAPQLLDWIAEKKAERLKSGAIPQQKHSARDVGRLTGKLPASWLPIAVGDICDIVTSGSRGWGEFYSTSGSGFIRAQNIRFGKLRLDNLAFVNPPSKSEGSRTKVAKGDLLIVITGAGVTNPALLDRDLGEAYVSQHVGLVRPSDQRLSVWLLLCLMADAGGRAELVERAYGAGKPGLNLDNIRSLSVPLPPLAEQQRIVAKVAALMALCDRLEMSLTATAATRRRLLDALLAEALAPAEDRELQAAE